MSNRLPNLEQQQDSQDNSKGYLAEAGPTTLIQTQEELKSKTYQKSILSMFATHKARQTKSEKPWAFRRWCISAYWKTYGMEPPTETRGSDLIGRTTLTNSSHARGALFRINLKALDYTARFSVHHVASKSRIRPQLKVFLNTATESKQFDNQKDKRSAPKCDGFSLLFTYTETHRKFGKHCGGDQTKRYSSILNKLQ